MSDVVFVVRGETRYIEVVVENTLTIFDVPTIDSVCVIVQRTGIRFF